MSKGSLQSKWLQERLKNEENFAMAFPQLSVLADGRDGTFRGLTAFIGDNNAIVIGFKRYSEEGEAQVLWSSGGDLLEALLNGEAALSTGKWRTDKRYNG